PHPFHAQLAIHGKKRSLHQLYSPKVAHALGLVRISEPELGLDVAEERVIFRGYTDELVAADRSLPVALDKFRVALDKGFARHRPPVGPPVRLAVLHEIIDLVKTLLQ